MAFEEDEKGAAMVEKIGSGISHSAQGSEKDSDYRQPSTPWSNFLIRFFRKEFGSSWEEQYKEYEEFWNGYFFAHTLN